MRWKIPLPEGFFRRSIRYILQRYLGQFLEEKLTLDQLSVDLFNGIGSVSNVSLDVQALNELAEQNNFPVEFVDGSIAELKVSIPWTSLLTDSSNVDVKGLHLVIQPKQRADNGASMFDSMWSSMTSSIQLAEECLKNTMDQIPVEEANPVNGVEEFARAIDSILNRTKLKFIDTRIRLEHLPKDSVIGGALELRIKQFTYHDETSNETSDDSPTKPASAYGVKLFSAEGVELYTSEFHASNRTMSRSLLFESAMSLNASVTEPAERCPMSQNDMILFGKFMGKQEVRLKIKQKENASGPKIDLEMNVSALAILASPRQLRIVCEMITGLMSPHLQDTSNVKPHHRVNQKPMTASDYERVEHVLHQHLNPSSVSDVMVKSLQNASGWSSAGRGEESDDGFRPVRGHYASSTMSDSASTTFSSSYTSTASSCYHSKLNEQFGYSRPRSNTNRHKDKSSGSESDFSGDIRKFEIRLNSLTVILLHRDILVSSDETRLPDETSVQEMKALSDSFFAHFVQSNLHGKPGRQPNITLDKNHFRLHCSTIILNGDEKSNLSNSEVSGSLSVAKLELLECLMELENRNEEIIELIRFMNPADVASDASALTRPDVVAHFKFSDDMKRFAAHKRTELNVMMRHCCTEIDVTTIDRMVDILSNVREFVTVLDKSTDLARPGLSDVHAPIVDSKVDWKVSSPFIRVKLRFPIPELKDECNDEYWFWHRRNVHNDLLFVELSELTIHSEISSHQLAQSYEFQAKSVRILFQESTAEKPVPFVFSRVDEKFVASLPNGGEGFDWPRLVLRVYPKVNYVELEDVEERMNTTRGMAQSIIHVEKKEPSPFSAKMVKRESDTSHSDSTSDSDGEEIILPGNKEEMGEFVEAASHNALLHVNLSLPSVVVVIPSKHFYELLYNRFSNDLMLWTPKASRQSHSFSDNQHSQNVHLNFGHAGSMFTSFSMCKSTLRTDSESEDEDACGNLLDGEMEKSMQKPDNEATDLSQSSITISLFVSHGVVDVFPHARDTKGNVIPEQYGEIHVMFQEANLFFVSGYKGEPLLNYLCLQVNHCTLYHCSLVPGCTENTLKPIDAYPSKYMLPTIYKTQAGGVVNESAVPGGTGSSISDDMLTLAIRVQGQENRVKNICVANSLNGVTIRHRMKVSYTSWLSQLIDFFDIKDYPISDYQPWKVVTQLHQQFLNCVIDYRPLYLPIKAALTVEDFNISSNITSKTATSILRFIAEEASLFVSCKVSDDRDNPQDLAIDLRNDYVCVVEMGLFELSMRLTERDSECEPETDLRASNNIVHIRTCADSAVALMELVKYVAGDGDLSDAQFTDEYSRKGSSGSGDDLLVRIELNEAEENPHIPCMGVPSTSESCVPQLVEEAMQDVPYEEPPKKRINHLRCTNESNVEVFYFPNEDGVSVASSYGQTFSDSLSSDEDIDSGYIYVDHDMDMGIGYVGQGNNAPEIRLLTKEPVRMVDNHFTVPINKVDVLKAPKGFPQPVSKYTLREMTIVWHMYGGNDFPKGDEDTKASDTKKHVVIAPERSGSSESLYSFDSGRTVKRKSTDSINIAYSATRSSEVPSVNFVLSPSPQYSYADLTTISPTSLHERHKNCSWLVAGGVNRTHDELMELKFQKLKYQYELYPKDTKQASRQVLIAQEVEISDRMATSQINKFLYQYSSSARPKQSHANMIVIKATYIRPELNVSHRQECCLRVSMLPLRLNIDQDSLLFLINFFNEISGNKNEDDAATVNTAGSKTVQQPVLNIEKMDPGPSAEERMPPSMGAAPVSTPTFIRSFIFTQDVPIRLDYAGKRVDMTHGPLAGLIMGLGQLNCSELKLKRLCNRHGILGFDKLISYVLSEWLNDIKKNQLPSILGGVGPMHSLVQLIQGVRDLFWLPIEQYQKDGRIVRGLQRGANSFTTSTAMAALELTARLVYAIQLIAETAFDLVSPGPSFRHRYGDRSGRNEFRAGFRNRCQYRYQRPSDFREGIVGAMQLMREGLGDTAQTLMRVASMENETKGAVGAVGGIIREMPSAALTPIILATQATSNVLDGVRSHLVPDARTEAALKWKTDYFD